MRPFIRQLQARTCTTAPIHIFRKPLTTQIPKITRARLSTDTSSKTSPIDTSNLHLSRHHINVVPGTKLSSHQQLIVRSIVDLFSGHPSLPHLALWRDDAVFSNPITIAQGRAKYSAQWYGRSQAFSEIDCINHQVRDAGNPMLMDLRIKYVVRGVGVEQLVQSLVSVEVDGEGRVCRVEDRWDGELKEGGIGEVSSIFRLLSPCMVMRRWVHGLLCEYWFNVGCVDSMNDMLIYLIGFSAPECRHNTQDCQRTENGGTRCKER
jgi:hypothetical protein